MIAGERCQHLALLQPHLPAIHALCRQYEVTTLEVFGSVCRADFTDERDIDFLVDYPPGHRLGPWMRDFQHLQRDLSALLQRDVDLVMMHAMRKPLFRDEVEEARTRIFAATADAEAA